MVRTKSSTIDPYKAFARGASVAVVCVGVAVLLGWVLDIAALKSIGPGMLSMKPNGALALCLAGASLWLSCAPRRSSRTLRMAQSAALLVALIGLLTFGEYALDQDLGLDSILFAAGGAPPAAALRMSPLTAINLTLTGIALLLLDVRMRGDLRPAQWMLLTVITTSLVVIFGYLYEVQALSHAGEATALALHTALTFLILAVAALYARHDQGLMRIVTSASAGGALARRLLLAVFVVPVALGLFRLAGERSGLLSSDLGNTFVAVATSALFAALIWWGARALDRSEARLHRANRALLTLSECNQALVRATSEPELLALVCRTIVESGGYPMVWVGYLAGDSIGTVRPIAHAGHDDGYLDKLFISSLADDEHGRGPTGTAIRTGRSVVARDLLHDSTYQPWRDEALRRGYASSIALPLLDAGKAFGALNIYAGEPDAFDAAETQLLIDLAGDLTYGIVALRTRAAHARAEDRLRAQAARLRLLADASQAFAATSREYQPLIDQIARMTAEHLEAGCILRLLSDDGQWLHTVTHYDRDPAVREAIRAIFGDSHIHVDEPHPAAIVVRSGQTLFIPMIDHEAVRASLAPELQAVFDRFRFHSAIVTPLRLQGATIGSLVLSRQDPALPAFDEDDLALAQDLADRAALAIQNARLFAQVQRSNAELEQRVAERTAEIARANAELQSENAERARLERQVRIDAERASALAELSRVLAEANLDARPQSHTGAEASIEYQPLLETIARRISELVGDTCVVTLLSDDRQWLQLMALYHPDSEGIHFMRALMATTPYRADEGPPGRVVQSGKALLLPVVPQAQIRDHIKPEYHVYLDRFGIASLLIVPLRARGRILGTLGVSRDRAGTSYTPNDQTFLQDLADRAGLAIENERLFVEVRQARALAEQASQAKTNFLRSTSHELRTPLNAIVGFTGMLLMRLPGPLTADQEQQLQTIQSSARHLLALINNLLDLSRVEAGKVELSLEQVVFQELVAEVVASLRPLAEQKGLVLEILAPEQAIAVRSDRRLLSQILINLISNAIKFTARGRVTITTSQRPANGSLQTAISVADTGVGIHPADLPRLFEPFARVDHPTTRASEGSGLGLHLSQQFAGLLGGHITIESEQGVGSCFTLVLEGR